MSKLLTAISGLLIVLAVTAPSASATLFIPSLQQDPSTGIVYFNVESDQYVDSFNGGNTFCDGSVSFTDTVGYTFSSEFFSSTLSGWDFMSTPISDFGQPPYTVTAVDISCDWTRKVRHTYRSVSTGWRWRGGAGIWKKVGAASTYSYLPGTVTIDNRRSSTPTIVYWRLWHPGRAFGASYYWNSRYSTPGAHPATWFPISSRVIASKITVSPHMMFTVTQLGVHYRVSRLVHETETVDVTGSGSWHR